MADVAITGEFRVSYPSLAKPHAFSPDQPAKYQITMLFPKTPEGKAAMQPVMDLLRRAVLEKFPDWDTMDAAKKSKLQFWVRDGDKEKADTLGYAGHMFIKAASKQRPKVVDQALNEISDLNVEEAVYAGCYCRASVTCFFYNKAGKVGFSFGLNNVQKLRDGEPFTGRTRPEDDFDAVASVDVNASSDDFDNMFSETPSEKAAVKEESDGFEF